MKYFKLIGTNHFTPAGKPYPYRIGLNTLAYVGEEFNTEPTCFGGGLYFTTADNIWKYDIFGNTLCVLSIPYNARVVHLNDKSKADRLFIEEMIPLFSREALEVLFQNGMCPMKHNYRIVWGAVTTGNLDVLKYTLERDFCSESETYLLRLSEFSLRIACQSGSLDIVKYLVEDRKISVHSVNVRDVNIAIDKKIGYLPVLEYLIENEAQDDIKSKLKRAH